MTRPCLTDSFSYYQRISLLCVLVLSMHDRNVLILMGVLPGSITSHVKC